MRKYALINNNMVTSILDLEVEDVHTHMKNNDMIIDIEDCSPQPKLNWILDGNQLVIPQGQSSKEQFEIELATRKTEFGIKLARNAVDRVGARNKILNKTGAQVGVLLNQLLSVKLLLETGALGTARNASVQLKSVFTEYADIFDLVISEVNKFEASEGL